MIGSSLARALENAGHTVTPLKRGRDYDIQRGTVELASVEGHDAIVHLAGESIAGLWTSAKRRAIRESRVMSTSLLATSLLQLRHPPRIFVCASATGFYGDRANEPLDEAAPKGSGFLADVVQAWEAATLPAAKEGARVVNMRFGVVLARDGGAMAPILPVFKLGLGGKLGSGRQIWSWVAIDDVVGALMFALTNDSLRGPVNVVAPQPVTNLAFTRALGRVLRRPTVFGVPEFVLKTAAGDMAREMLLSSARVVPRKLEAAGYKFQYPELEVALRHLLAEG